MTDADDKADIAARLADVVRVRGLLVAHARAGEPVSYSQLLAEVGTRFTRPKMRALMKTLDRIDELGAADGEPELAVLVVRESDGLPGQGWWAGGHAERLGHEGDWTAPAAAALVKRVQAETFAWWAER